MKVKFQSVAGLHDYFEVECECGRSIRVGCGEKNFGEVLYEKRRRP